MNHALDARPDAPEHPAAPPAWPGPDLAAFERAQRGREIARRTPMETSRFLGRLEGVPVHLKCENLQRTGSYKLRGRTTDCRPLVRRAGARGRGRVGRQPRAGRRVRGARARHPRRSSCPSASRCPSSRPRAPTAPTWCSAATRSARPSRRPRSSPPRPARRSSRRSTTPTSSPGRARSASRSSSRFRMSRPSSCRSAAAASRRASRVRRSSRPRIGRTVRIVQAENASPYPPSLTAGEPTSVPTIADGIAVYRPGELNFAIIRETIDEIVTVTEDDIARPCSCCSSARSSWSSRRRGRRRRAHDRQVRSEARSSCCCRAGTSTRCSCSA